MPLWIWKRPVLEAMLRSSGWDCHHRRWEDYRSYETDVNPHERLDEHIKQLTGLTDARLKKAPEFAQVAKEIFELIEDAVFVAHNVKFDANLLAEALFWEGFELTTPRIDTVELSQIFYPTLERYNLGALAAELEIELHHAHSALADAMATAQLLLKLREKIASLPRGLNRKTSFDGRLFDL